MGAWDRRGGAQGSGGDNDSRSRSVRAPARPRSRVASAGHGEMSRARTLALDVAAKAQASGQHAMEVVALHDIARLGDPTASRLGRLTSLVDGPFAPACALHASALEAGDGSRLNEATPASPRWAPTSSRRRRRPRQPLPTGQPGGRRPCSIRAPVPGCTLRPARACTRRLFRLLSPHCSLAGSGRWRRLRGTAWPCRNPATARGLDPYRRDPPSAGLHQTRRVRSPGTALAAPSAWLGQPWGCSDDVLRDSRVPEALQPARGS
jgi:hypothetical protein